MKKFISGLIVGVMLSVLPISAAIEEYICYRSGYKVMINGEEYINEDLPILNYNSNTYYPEIVLAAAGLDVVYNAVYGSVYGQIDIITTVADSVYQEENVHESVYEEEETKEVIMSNSLSVQARLPEGAEIVEYKGCKKAVSYNDNIYISRNDLTSKFGIESIYIDVKTHSTIFIKGDKTVTIDYESENARILSLTGTAYYNASLLSELIGE